MRNHEQNSNRNKYRRYLFFGTLILLMTINDISLGLHILESVTLPVLLTSSIVLKTILFSVLISLIAKHNMLIERSETDLLTKAYTREVFFNHLDRLISSQGGGRAKEAISVILFDLDSFKNINDKLGHHIGDRVLSQVSATTQSIIRHDDVFARLGGEEFGIVLPRTSIAEAVRLAERLRASIDTITTSCNDTYAVSASFGVASWNGEETIDQLYARADGLMYNAKHLGKNRVVRE
jgi:two-component system cell cycle response regulator